eukprot:166003_1
MDLYAGIDYTCNSVSQLEQQLIQSFQSRSSRSVQSTSIDIESKRQHQELEIFLLKERLETIQSKCSTLEIENKCLKTNNYEQQLIIGQLRLQMSILQTQNNHQLSQLLSVKEAIKSNLEKHTNDMMTLSSIFNNHSKALEERIMCLSDKIKDCKTQYYQQSVQVISAAKKSKSLEVQMFELKAEIKTTIYSETEPDNPDRETDCCG